MVEDLFTFLRVVNYLLAVIFFSGVALTFVAAKKFYRTNQRIPWIMICLCTVFIFLSQMVYIVRDLQGAVQVSFGLTLVDVLTYVGAFLFSAGALTYYSIIHKSIGKGVPVKQILLVFFSGVLVFLAALFLTGEDLAYALGIGILSFVGFSCLPLMFTFKGGKISKLWYYFSLGIFLIVLSAMIDFIDNWLLWDLSVVFYFFAVSGSLLFAYSFYILLKN